MIDIWSSSVLAKIFIIDGVGYTPNTAAFCWRCFQTNKPLLKSEHLVLVAVYLKILNACKLIVMKIAIWRSLYDLNQILIRFLQSKLISSFYEQITLIWSSVNSLFYWAFCSIYRWREFDKCVIHPSPDPSPWIKSLQTTNQHLTYCWTTNQNAFLNHSLTPFPLPWAV